jgi:hypothetical protein
VVVGPGAQLCTLLEVWVLGVGMSTVGAKMSLYVEDRGLQVPMTLEHDNIVVNVVTQLIRPIRVDHTDFFKWILNPFILTTCDTTVTKDLSLALARFLRDLTRLLLDVGPAGTASSPASHLVYVRSQQLLLGHQW